MDIDLNMTEDGVDFSLELGDLKHDAGLRTPVLVALFSDGRVEETEDLPDGETDPRGWWADSFDDTRMGSLLWTLNREKITGPVMARIQATGEEALEWLIRDGIADEITVEVTRLNTDRIRMRVEVTRGSATQGADLWDSLLSDPRTFDSPRLQVHLLTA
jgi:phage gp46-like protein